MQAFLKKFLNKKAITIFVLLCFFLPFKSHAEISKDQTYTIGGVTQKGTLVPAGNFSYFVTSSGATYKVSDKIYATQFNGELTADGKGLLLYDNIDTRHSRPTSYIGPDGKVANFLGGSTAYTDEAGNLYLNGSSPDGTGKQITYVIGKDGIAKLAPDGIPNDAAPAIKFSDQLGGIGCDHWYTTPWECIALPVLAGVGNMIMSFFALFLYIVGEIFDWLILGTIVNMSSTFGQMTDAINAGWSAGKNIANMLFIVILIYLAIETVLDLGHDTKKKVIRVIVMAILINFSLFFTEVMIDMSNAAATGIYYDMKHTIEEHSHGGIAGAFMSVLNLQRLLNNKNPPLPTDKIQPSSFKPGILETKQQAATNDIGLGKIIFITIFGSFTMFSTAMIFLASIFLLSGRVVYFLMLMVFSPLAFAAMAIPDKDYANSKYWTPLINNALFAPLYMVFLNITMKIILDQRFTDALTSSGSPSSSLIGLNDHPALNTLGLGLGLGSLIQILYIFLIVNTMALTSLVVAKELGIEGADAAMDFVTKAKGAFKGVVGRRIVRGIDTSGMHELPSWAQGEFGLRRLDEKMRQSKFFGNNAFFGDTLQKYTTGQLVDMKFGSEKSATEAYHEDHEFASKRDSINKRNKALDIIKGKGEFKNLTGREKDIAIQAAIGDLTKKEVAEMVENDHTLLHNKDFLKNMTDDQRKAIKDSDHLTESEKREAMQTAFKDRMELAVKVAAAKKAYDKAFNDRTEYKDPDTGKVVADFSDKNLTTDERAELYTKHRPNGPAMDSTVYETYRRITVDGIRDMNFAYPGMLTENRYTDEHGHVHEARAAEMILYGAHDQARAAGIFSEAQGQNFRDAKSQDFIDAQNMQFGINTDADVYQIPASEGGLTSKERDDLWKGVNKYATAFPERSDHLEQFIKSVPAGITKKKYDQLVIKNEDQRKAWVAAGKELMHSNYEGKQANEIQKNKSHIRLLTPVIRDLGADHIQPLKGNQDQGENKVIQEVMIADLLDESRDLSKQNSELLYRGFDRSDRDQIYTDDLEMPVVDRAKGEFVTEPDGTVKKIALPNIYGMEHLLDNAGMTDKIEKSKATKALLLWKRNVSEARERQRGGEQNVVIPKIEDAGLHPALVQLVKDITAGRKVSVLNTPPTTTSSPKSSQAPKDAQGLDYFGF